MKTVNGVIYSPNGYTLRFLDEERKLGDIIRECSDRSDKEVGLDFFDRVFYLELLDVVAVVNIKFVVDMNYTLDIALFPEPKEKPEQPGRFTSHQLSMIRKRFFGRVFIVPQVRNKEFDWSMTIKDKNNNTVFFQEKMEQESTKNG